MFAEGPSGAGGNEGDAEDEPDKKDVGSHKALPVDETSRL